MGTGKTQENPVYRFDHTSGRMEPPVSRVKETLLSRKPRHHSVQVAALSLLSMLLVSLLCWKEGPETTAQLAAVPERILQHQEYWRLLTAIGVHADLPHFASNALLFSLFSYLLYGYFGFWIFPVWSLLLGSLANYFAILTYPPGTHLVGSSGVVYLMAGFWLTMYVLVERRLSLKKRLLHAVGVALIVFLPTSLQEQVSYRTHAIGFGLGTLLAAGHFQRRKEEIRRAEVVEQEGWEDLLKPADGRDSPADPDAEGGPPPRWH